MLVRLNKRGPTPHKSSGWIAPKPSGMASHWGRVIEVEKIDARLPFCDEQVFVITDSRIATLFPRAIHICGHYLIDDLDAYESDSADEQAEIGDLAAIQLPQTQKVRA